MTVQQSGYTLGPLQSGQRVAVVGGGPAGTSCAIALRRRGEALGRDVRVVLYEPRDFISDANVCVGVTSPPFGRLLAGLGVTIPEAVVQRRIRQYVLHTDTEHLDLPNPPEDREPTLALRRIDLDRFMLQSARDAGVEVASEGAVEFRLDDGAAEVRTDSSGWQRFDAIVCAFGLSGPALKALESATPYRRPPLMRSVLTNIQIGHEAVERLVGDNIHAFLLSSQPQIEFAALTPKGDHVTVNAAGVRITEADLKAIIDHARANGLLPETLPESRRYHSAFPAGPARDFFSDRWVAIGNASGLLRPLKGKGLTAGILTGTRAARVMLEEGISKEAFEHFYKLNHDITSDYHYGLALRSLYRLSRRLGYLDPVIGLARHDRTLYRAFHTMVSGEGTYADVVKRFANPVVWPRIVAAIARFEVTRGVNLLRRKT